MKSALLLMMLALVGATGCEKKIDTEKGETVIAEDLKARGLEATVKCPRDIKLAKGVSFKCTGTTKDAEAITINVEQTDDKGNVSWLLEQIIADEREMDAQITKNLGAPSTVKCPKHVIKADETVNCTLTAKGQTVTLYVHGNADGKGVTWDVKPPGK